MGSGNGAGEGEGRERVGVDGEGDRWGGCRAGMHDWDTEACVGG